MAVVEKAGTGVHSASAATIAEAYAAAVTAGNRLCCSVSIRASITLTDGMVTDGESNPWAVDYQFGDANVKHGFYSCVAGTSGTPTVTFAPTVTGRIGIRTYEISGIADHDGVTQVGATATSTAPDSGSFTPTAATGIVFAIFGGNNAITWESDYGTGAMTFSTNSRFGAAYDLAPAASAQTASGTCTSQLWYLDIAWYPDSAAAGVVGPLLQGHLLSGGILAGRLVGR